MSIFNHPPDLRFFVMVGTLIISLIAGVIAVKNYKLTKSFDLLLIAISHFSYTVWMLVWLTNEFAYFNIEYFVSHEMCWAMLNPCGFDFWFLFFEFIEQFAWSTGWYALFLHSFRLFNFKHRSRIMKAILGIIFIEITALYFYVLSGVITFWIEGTYAHGGYVYPLHRWFNRLWIAQIFFSNLDYPIGHIGLNLDLFILHVFISIAYLQAKPVIKTIELKITKIIWILYSITISIVYLQFFFNSYSNALQRPVNNPLYLFNTLSQYLDIQTVIQILIMAGFVPVMILILLYPKAMIMTEPQLLNAKNLYKLFDIEEESRKIGPFELNAKQQIHSYLQELPEEIKVKIRKDQ